MENAESDSIDLKAIGKQIQEWITEVETVIVGQKRFLERVLLALLCQGHLLVEGVPGLAKTLTLRTIAQTLQLSTKRIQFTPDLLPGDIIGTTIYEQKSGEFTIKKGPVFAHFILADEINRAPAKVQSALLEAMQESQVTIGDTTFLLPRPFLVMATQNPIEQQGTYPLPEAQIDRFMMKIVLDYPTIAEETKIVERMATMQNRWQIRPIISAEDLTKWQTIADATYISPKLIDYIIRLVHFTRNPAQLGFEWPKWIERGASPRASIALVRLAKAHAFLQQRQQVLPEDIKAIAIDTLRHRLTPNYEAEAEQITAADLIQRMLKELPLP